MSPGEQAVMAIDGMAAWATIVAGLVVRTYGKAFCWGIVFWLLLALLPLGVLLVGGTPVSGPKWAAYELPRLPVFVLAALAAHGLRRLVRLAIRTVRGSKTGALKVS